MKKITLMALAGLLANGAFAQDSATPTSTASPTATATERSAGKSHDGSCGAIGVKPKAATFSKSGAGFQG